jgi:hypothetical protein
VDAAPTPVDGYTSAFQLLGVLTLVGAVVMFLTINPERDRARIARIDALTDADGSVEDSELYAASSRREPAASDESRGAGS